MDRYFLRVEWKNRETTMIDNLTWYGVMDYLNSIYATAMNESVYQVKFYPVVVRVVEKEGPVKLTHWEKLV